VVHTGNHQACIDDVRNIWEIFVSLMSTDSLISHVFSSPTFSYTLIWFVEIYVKDLILDLLLVKPIMEMGINIVDDVKYISFMMAYFVLVVVWH